MANSTPVVVTRLVRVPPVAICRNRRLEESLSEAQPSKKAWAEQDCFAGIPGVSRFAALSELRRLLIYAPLSSGSEQLFHTISSCSCGVAGCCPHVWEWPSARSARSRPTHKAALRAATMIISEMQASERPWAEKDCLGEMFGVSLFISLLELRRVVMCGSFVYFQGTVRQNIFLIFLRPQRAAARIPGGSLKGLAPVLGT